MTLQIFGMCNWSWTWFRPDGAWSAEDIAGTFMRVMLGGLVADGPAFDLPGDVITVVRDAMAGVVEAPAAAA